MQALLTVAIVAVAIAAMGVGFLGQPLNLMVQGLIVGEKTLDAPITKALLDFVIDRTSYTFGSDTTMMRNVIDECIIESPQTMDRGSIIFCKLTDMMNNVVAEGMKVLTRTLNDDTPTNIPIIQAFVLPSGIPSNDVTNINDVVVVVQGPPMTGQTGGGGGGGGGGGPVPCVHIHFITIHTPFGDFNFPSPHLHLNGICP